MFRSKYITISIIIMSLVLLGNSGWALTSDELILQMKEQMDRMQNRLIELEKRNAALEERLDDQEKDLNERSKSSVHIDKPASQAKEVVDYVIGKFRFCVLKYGYAKKYVPFFNSTLRTKLCLNKLFVQTLIIFSSSPHIRGWQEAGRYLHPL